MTFDSSAPLRRCVKGATLPVLLMAAAGNVQAAWQGWIGAGVFHLPEYLGSDDYETRISPFLGLRYGDRFQVSVRDGISWKLVESGRWSLSPFLGYTSGRDNGDALRHLDRVDGGATVGVRAAYEKGPWHFRTAVKTPVSGDVDGFQLKLGAGWRDLLSERVIASLGPFVTYSSEKWTEDMFGVSAHERRRSGLAAYNPDDGHFRAGVTGSLSYRLTSDWWITGLLGVSRIMGDAADSPIVESIGDETQALAGALVRYHF